MLRVVIETKTHCCIGDETIPDIYHEFICANSVQAESTFIKIMYKKHEYLIPLEQIISLGVDEY